MNMSRGYLVKSCSLIMLAVFVGCASLQPVPSVSAESKVPRAEHPKPQFRREAWVNLNGEWDFAMDGDVVGIKENWEKDSAKFNKKITVPFCVESKLSGIGHTDFINAVWYRRTFTLPKAWRGERSRMTSC